MQTESIARLEPPFHCERTAIQWFWNYQPLSILSVNITEPENKPRSKLREIGYEPIDIYAAVLQALKQLEKDIQTSNEITREVYRKYFLGYVLGDIRKRWGADEIAEQIKVSRQTVYRAIKQIYDDMYYEFLRFGLVCKRESST